MRWFVIGIGALSAANAIAGLLSLTWLDYPLEKTRVHDFLNTVVSSAITVWAFYLLLS